ncbi:MAG TPA: hypothetical protein VKD72_06305 [Gemmataceae bacterium]|nr:hypothetical protein [Gemmataceae bacterium]
MLLRSSSTWPIRASGVCASMTWRSAAGVRSLASTGLARVASWRVLSSYARTESGMNLLDTLASCAGAWRGTSTLQDPHANIADVSPSTATVTALPEGQVRLDDTWAYRGKPQHGSLLVTCDGSLVTASWTDSWHTPNQPMVCFGPAAAVLSMDGRAGHLTDDALSRAGSVRASVTRNLPPAGLPSAPR